MQLALQPSRPSCVSGWWSSGRWFRATLPVCTCIRPCTRCGTAACARPFLVPSRSRVPAGVGLFSRSRAPGSPCTWVVWSLPSTGSRTVSCCVRGPGVCGVAHHPFCLPCRAGRIAPGAAQKLIRALVRPPVGHREPVVSEFTRVCTQHAETPQRELWTPRVDVRLAERFVVHALGSVTFEFRVFSMYETVSGPRGLWWDELVRLFAERLDFSPSMRLGDGLGHQILGLGLQIALDPPFLSGKFLWSPMEE
jgi:hypothetical protein